MKRLIAADGESSYQINLKVRQGNFSSITEDQYSLIKIEKPTPEGFRKMYDFFENTGYNVIFNMDRDGEVLLTVSNLLTGHNDNKYICFIYDYHKDTLKMQYHLDSDMGNFYKNLDKLNKYGITSHTKVNTAEFHEPKELGEVIKESFIYSPDKTKNPLVPKRQYPIITDKAIESIYEHEYKLAYIEMLSRRYSFDEELQVAEFEISQSYKELIDQLYNVLLEAIKLWLAREAHWLGSTISNGGLRRYYDNLPEDVKYDEYHSKKSTIFKWIKENYLDHPDKFISDAPEWVQHIFDDPELASPKIYDGIKKGYQNLLAHRNDEPRSKSAWLNYGISLAHNNGTMAQKFIRIKKYSDEFHISDDAEPSEDTIKRFLDKMSNLDGTTLKKWERDIDVLVRRRMAKRLRSRSLFGR